MGILRADSPGKESCLFPEAFAHDAGHTLGHGAYLSVVLALDHDANERLGAGDARHDAALLAQFALGFVDGALDFGVCVKQQLADKDSLLNYYRRIITIKNQNPEIARGRIVGTQGFDDKAVGAYYVEYEDSKLLIIHNFSKNDAKELTITDDMIKNATLRADLIPESSSKHTELKDGKISVPPQSTVIIKSAE